MTSDDISAKAVTAPLLAVHTQEDHALSKRAGISTPSVEEAKFCSQIVKPYACNATFLKFHHTMNAFYSKTFKCSVKQDFTIPEDKPKIL